MKKSMLLIAAISLFVSVVAQAKVADSPRPKPRHPDSVVTCPNGQPPDDSGRCHRIATRPQ